ncbi:MAG: hypothetical protein ACJAY2_000274 [Pseudomonadales bacterium]|jgi:hypothetical protein
MSICFGFVAVFSQFENPFFVLVEYTGLRECDTGVRVNNVFDGLVVLELQ